MADAMLGDETPKSPRHCPQILIVEDNPADVTLIREALRECSVTAEITVAKDGEQAMEMLEFLGHQMAKPDLVLLDLNLPRRDGYEVLERLRGTPEFRTTPVAIVTSSLRAADMDRAYRHGANWFVPKGTDLKTFENNISNLFAILS